MTGTADDTDPKESLMSITSQYIEATRKMQENWFSAVDAMTSQFSQQLERPTAMMTPSSTVDPRKVVDELFDFYAKALTVQRETAHKILDANQQVGSQWNQQAEEFYAAWREQAKTMTETARQQMESFANSAREQALQFGQVVEEKVAEAQAASRDQAERFTNAAAEQTKRMTSVATEQTQRATDTAKAQTETVADAANEQTKRNYNLMNTAQLKSELAAKGLDTSGSLDELRTRLREHEAQA